MKKSSSQLSEHIVEIEKIQNKLMKDFNDIIGYSCGDEFNSIIDTINTIESNQCDEYVCKDMFNDSKKNTRRKKRTEIFTSIFDELWR